VQEPALSGDSNIITKKPREPFLHNPRRSLEILSRISFEAVEYTTIEARNEPSRTVYHGLPARLTKLRDFLKFRVALCRSRQVGKLTKAADRSLQEHTVRQSTLAVQVTGRHKRRKS